MTHPDITIPRAVVEQALEAMEPYATLHHDDGYFTTKQREHDLRYSGPMRTEVFTRCQLMDAIAALQPQAASPAYTTGHCKNKVQPGGCLLHNLQCGYPECDRVPK